MAEFDVQKFAEAPSLEKLSSCTKKQLLAIADHYQIDVNKNARVEDIKLVIFADLVKEGLVEEVLVE